MTTRHAIWPLPGDDLLLQMVVTRAEDLLTEVVA